MRAAATFVMALFVLAPLAGCLSGDEAAAPSASEGDNETDPTFVAPDERGSLVAFEETNRTEEGEGGVDHHHDYWEGRSRALMFEESAEMRPMGAAETLEYEAQATFQPPTQTDDSPPALVFEGTETVEFTVSEPRRRVCEGEFTLGGHYVCTDNFLGVPRADDPTGGPSGMLLRYKHAATTTWIDGGQLVWGEPLPLKITNPRQTDMPHATASLWEFQVLSPNKHDSTLVFTAKAEIIRGEGDVPEWPGHPNFYADSTARKVLSANAAACDDGFGTTACLLASGETGPSTPERLISYGTRTVYVWINISDVQAPNPATAPTNWFLWHWNATGRNNVTDVFDSDEHPLDKREHLWILPVDDNGMDSPYGDGSRWRFQLGAALQTALSCYGGCAEWSAEYTIEVIASNQTLDASEYEMYCLRDDYCPQPESGGEGGDERAAVVRSPTDADAEAAAVRAARTDAWN